MLRTLPLIIHHSAFNVSDLLAAALLGAALAAAADHLRALLAAGAGHALGARFELIGLVLYLPDAALDRAHERADARA